MDTQDRYRVLISETARTRLRDTIIPYLLKNFSENRAVEILGSILNNVDSLAIMPNRGAKESFLEHDELEPRYILHRETRHFEVKILYFSDDRLMTVQVTDFFPTRMRPDSMYFREED
jgi:plasmid stabilization system protein ParE